MIDDKPLPTGIRLAVVDAIRGLGYVVDGLSNERGNYDHISVVDLRDMVRALDSLKESVSSLQRIADRQAKRLRDGVTDDSAFRHSSV